MASFNCCGCFIVGGSVVGGRAWEMVPDVVGFLAKKAGITTRSLTLVAVYVISFLNEC